MLAQSFLIKSSSKLLVTRTGIKARMSLISVLWFPWPIYMFFEMRFDLGTLDSGERSLPFGLLVFNLRVMEIQLYYFKTLCPDYVLFDFICFLWTCVKMDTPEIKKRTSENGPHTIAKIGVEGELFWTKNAYCWIWKCTGPNSAPSWQVSKEFLSDSLSHPT